MAILDDVKLSLRINGTALDTEITDLITAAQADLTLTGILSTKTADTTDTLIKRAIMVYCKANFGFDNPEAERFQTAYDMLKGHLALSQEYTVEAVV